MKALCWNGIKELRVETVNDPEILNAQDAILKVKLSSVCGSDLHFINGFIPAMKPGDILGHEFVGEVVETGPGVQKLKKGDRVVVASAIGCGECYYCKNDEWSLCDNSNQNGYIQENCSDILLQHFMVVPICMEDMPGATLNIFVFRMLTRDVLKFRKG